MSDASRFPAPVYKETVLAPLFEGVKRHHWTYLMRINYAHAVMLGERGILTAEELAAIVGGLAAIVGDLDLERLTYTGEHEDFFFYVDAELRRRIGPDVAGKLLEVLPNSTATDITMEGGMRWLTVRPPGSDSQDLLLMDPGNSMLDDQTAQQVRALVAKGALSPGVMATTDCAGDHAMLAARGVQFTQEPAKRPYGVEAVLRDDSGNWYSFTQRTY